MTILLITFAIFIGSIILVRNVRWEYEIPFGIAALVSGIALLMMLIAIWVNHTDGKREVVAKKMEYELIMKSRTTHESIERFGKLDLIVKYNDYVLNAQYWNEGMTDIFVHDSVDELKLIQ